MPDRRMCQPAVKGDGCQALRRRDRPGGAGGLWVTLSGKVIHDHPSGLHEPAAIGNGLDAAHSR
jgi:hypothetical protein